MLMEAMMERYVLCPYQLAVAGMARGNFACEDNPDTESFESQEEQYEMPCLWQICISIST